MNFISPNSHKMTQFPEEVQSNEATKDVELGKKLLENHHESSNTESRPVEKYRLWFSKRFLILILLFLGYLLTASLNLSINIVIVEMTSRKNTTVGDKIIEKAADFNWDSRTIGLVQASSNYGVLLSALGGYLATRFGGSVIYGISTVSEALLALLCPVCLKWNFYSFIACRSVISLFDGFAFASTAEILSRWVPQKERSIFLSAVLCGGNMAISASYPVFGNVAYYWGWQMVFFVTGGSTLIWAITWLIIAANEPSEDRFISKKEQRYIVSETEIKSRKKIIHPYWKIITSPAVWALCVGKMTYSWEYFLISGCLPLYVRDALKAEVNKVGVISSIPNFVCIFMIPLAGATINYLQNNTKLKPSQIHKIIITFGYITSAIIFVVAALSSNFAISMACFILVKLLLSFNSLILELTCLYLAPNHSGIIIGISVFWSVISQITMPFSAGFIVVNHTIQEWNTCFLLTAGVMVLGATVYLIYGSSEIQSWAVTKDSIDEDEK